MSALEADLPSEPEWGDILDLSDKVSFLMGCIRVADRASFALQDGDFVGATVALMDYHALRSEHAEVDAL